jgi:low temperature requirement protein LtrA
MQGMESQDDWSVSPATCAFLGMAIAFVIWSWYFDAAGAVAARHVRTRRDAIRFHLWSYAHLPLYLGIATVAAGIERTVHLADKLEIHRGDGVILGVSLEVVMLAMTVIAATRPGHDDRRGTTPRHLCVTALTVTTSVVVSGATPVVLISALTLLCAAQLALSPYVKGFSSALGP